MNILLHGAYVETDRPNPLGVYGRTKLAGDEALLASGCDASILRVSWVYGMHGGHFLPTMQRLMAVRDSLNIVDDQIGAPTWCRRIAKATGQAQTKMSVPDADKTTLSGIYHYAPSGHTSWYGFATAIREARGYDCTLKPITTTKYPTPAKRPASSRMSSEKLQHTFGIVPNE